MKKRILYNILNEWRDEDMDDSPIDIDDDLQPTSSDMSDEPNLDDDEYILSTTKSKSLKNINSPKFLHNLINLILSLNKKDYVEYTTLLNEINEKHNEYSFSFCFSNLRYEDESYIDGIFEEIYEKTNNNLKDILQNDEFTISSDTYFRLYKKFNKAVPFCLLKYDITEDEHDYSFDYYFIDDDGTYSTMTVKVIIDFTRNDCILEMYKFLNAYNIKNHISPYKLYLINCKSLIIDKNVYDDISDTINEDIVDIFEKYK